MDLPAPAAPLFELPPEEFTAERDRVARELKASGDPAGAAEVKALKRPSLAAHALNLVARRHGELVERLLDAGDRLGGATSRAPMEAAKAQRQQAISEVTARALELLGDRAAGAQLQQKITATLLAAATDEATRRQLRAGELLREAEPTGFGGPVVAFEPAAGGGGDPGIAERVEKLRAEAAAKLAEAQRARAESDRAEREHRELAEAAAAARSRAERLAGIARRAEERAAERLAEAERLEGGTR